MSSSGKRYSREYKIEVVRRVQNQKEVANELGVAPNTFSRWMRQLRDEKAEAFLARAVRRRRVVGAVNVARDCLLTIQNGWVLEHVRQELLT